MLADYSLGLGELPGAFLDAHGGLSLLMRAVRICCVRGSISIRRSIMAILGIGCPSLFGPTMLVWMVHLQIRDDPNILSPKNYTQIIASTYHSFTGRVFFSRYLYILSSCLSRSFWGPFGGTYTSPANKGCWTRFSLIIHYNQKSRQLQRIQVNDKYHRPLNTITAGLGAGTDERNLPRLKR